MVKKIKHVPAGPFKAKYLELLDEVAASGEEIVVTKRGKPVARILPPAPPLDEDDPLKGSVIPYGDIVSPLDDEGDMEK